MGQVILVLVVVGLTIYAVADCLRTDDTELRGMPKPLWLLVIVFLAPVGGVAWLLFGGPGLGGQDRAGGHTFGRPARRVSAPDDDPDFLRSLNPPRRDED